MSTSDKAGMEGFGSCLFLLGILVLFVVVGALIHGWAGALIAVAVYLTAIGALFVWAADGR